MFSRWINKLFSIESKIRNHPSYKEAYKIEGYVIPSEKTIVIDGVDVNYSKAVLILCVKNSDEQYKAWESAEYKYHDDALNVLKAESLRISEIISKRIEIIDFSHEQNEFQVVEIYNKDSIQYALESTNL